MTAQQISEPLAPKEKRKEKLLWWGSKLDSKNWIHTYA